MSHERIARKSIHPFPFSPFIHAFPIHCFQQLDLTPLHSTPLHFVSLSHLLDLGLCEEYTLPDDRIKLDERKLMRCLGGVLPCGVKITSARRAHELDRDGLPLLGPCHNTGRMHGAVLTCCRW